MLARILPILSTKYRQKVDTSCSQSASSCALLRALCSTLRAVRHVDGPINKPLPIIKKLCSIVLKSAYIISLRQIKVIIKHLILTVGIKYSLNDLLFDVNKYV